MNISFTENAWEDYLYWQKMDKKTVKRINNLIKAIKRNPFEGPGKPEPLKYDLAGKWSRRIIDEHRLVYQVDGENLICHGSNSPQLCCVQNFTEQSEVGANTPQLCCGEIYLVFTCRYHY